MTNDSEQNKFVESPYVIFYVKNIPDLVEITFQEIYRLNQQGYINKPLDESFTPRRIYVWDLLFSHFSS